MQSKKSILHVILPIIEEAEENLHEYENKMVYPSSRGPEIYSNHFDVICMSPCKQHEEEDYERCLTTATTKIAAPVLIQEERQQNQQTPLIGSNRIVTPPQIKKCKPQQVKKTRQPRVRFHSHVAVYANVYWSREDCASMWYTAEDYTAFRHLKALHTKQVTLQERSRREDPFSYRNVMERVYQAYCSHTSYNYNNNYGGMDGDDEANKMKHLNAPLTPLDAQQFDQWMSTPTAEYRLGLEVGFCNYMARDRQFRKKDLMQSVLEIQAECAHSPRRHVILALTCQPLTQPSVLWARKWAEAIH